MLVATPPIVNACSKALNPREHKRKSKMRLAPNRGMSVAQKFVIRGSHGETGTAKEGAPPSDDVAIAVAIVVMYESTLYMHAVASRTLIRTGTC